MNNTKLNCSLNDTTILRNLILENPKLPVLIFCGEEAWQGEHVYNQADASEGTIEELTLYNDMWFSKEDYKEEITSDLAYEGEYEHMTSKEFFEMVDNKVADTEFVKVIVIYVG